jgi:hypothetical protein
MADSTDAPTPASTPLAPTPAQAPAPAAETPPRAGGFRLPFGQAKGDFKFGMSFWGAGSLVAGIASDLAKPVADLAGFFFFAFLIALAAAVYLAYVRKPALDVAQTAVGALGMGVAVFGFFLVARTVATPGDLGVERGFIAAIAPPVAAVQTAVLPLSQTEKDLLEFSTAISKGDPEARSAMARAGLASTEDAPLRRAMLERTLRSSDVNVRQAGIAQAIEDHGRQPMPVLTNPRDRSALATFLTGAQIGFRAFDPVGGTGYGGLSAGGGTRGMNAVVANGRLIATSQYLRDGAWKDGLVIDVAVDHDFKLVGTARTPEDAPIKVEIPLL